MNAQALRTRVAELLGEEPTDDQENLLDLGLDSIRLMAIVEQLRGDGHDVSFVDLAEQPTIAAWAGLLRERP
jgi:bifunctional isochorismate lyase / aryl carrier protein